MKARIDLNADLGEGMGHDGELLRLVSSANIATGAHAGDPEIAARTIREAMARNVAVGAHPGFADRENFGRVELALSPVEIIRLVTEQLAGFCRLAASLGARVNHLKPHGALYNMAARDPAVARAVAAATAAVDASLIVFAPVRSPLAQAAAEAGLAVAREVFADRNYLGNGELVPRTRPEALLHDAGEAAQRVLRMLREGRVTAIDGTEVAVEAETVCVHGDTPDAVAFAGELRRLLAEGGVVVEPPLHGSARAEA